MRHTLSDRHHKVSSVFKACQNSQSSVKYEENGIYNSVKREVDEFGKFPSQT